MSERPPKDDNKGAQRSDAASSAGAKLAPDVTSPSAVAPPAPSPATPPPAAAVVAPVILNQVVAATVPKQQPDPGSRDTASADRKEAPDTQNKTSRVQRALTTFYERVTLPASVLYLILMPFITALLVSLAIWAGAVALLSQNKELWERIVGLVGGASTGGIAIVVARWIPPLTDDPKFQTTARRLFLILTVSLALLFGYGEFRLLSRGIIDNPLAYPSVVERVGRMESRLDLEVERTRALTSTLDLYHQLLTVRENRRTWQQVKSMPGLAYRVDVTSTDLPRGSTIELLVLDEEGKILLGQRTDGERPIQLRTIFSDSGHAYNLGLRWWRAGAGAGPAEANDTKPDGETANPAIAHLGVTLVQDDSQSSGSHLTADAGVPLQFGPADSVGLAHVPIKIENITPSEHSSYDSGRCGGGSLPDRTYQLTVPSDGWLHAKASAVGSALALYLLRSLPHATREGDGGGNGLEEIACEASVESAPPPDPPPSTAQLQLAVKAGTYTAVLDTRVSESVNAKVEFALEPLTGVQSVVNVPDQADPIPIDLLEAPSESACDGRVFLKREITVHAAANGTYQAIVTGGEDPWSMFGRGDRIQLSWRDPAGKKDGACGTAAATSLQAAADGVLRVYAATIASPPFVQVRFQKTLSDTERQDRLAKACARAISLTEGVSTFGDTRSLPKEDDFALSRGGLAGNTDLRLSFKEARALGAGTADRVFKITTKAAGTAHLVMNSTSKATLVAYFLPACSMDSQVQEYDTAIASTPAEVTTLLDAGTHYIVVDGAGSTDEGPFSLRWDRLAAR